MHSDPVADLLTRIRNAYRARQGKTSVPFSKLKLEIARILKQEGYIGDFIKVAGKTPGQSVIEMALRYDERKEPVVTGIKRVSTPGMRSYMRVHDIPKVRSGLGIMIVSTSKGLMTDREAKKNKIGGEALCAVW